MFFSLLDFDGWGKAHLAEFFLAVDPRLVKHKNLVNMGHSFAELVGSAQV